VTDEKNNRQGERKNAMKSNREDSEAKIEKVVEKEYKKMSTEALVCELEKLIRSYQAHRIKNQVNEIREAFNKKNNEVVKAKKTAFIEAGGEEKDFSYYDPDYRRFIALIKDFKVNLQVDYKAIEEQQEKNLKIRWSIIEELKMLYLNPDIDYHQVFKKFKALKERWHNTGEISKNQVSNVFNTYRHHLHNYYEYLKLNRNLETLEHKHNLEVKENLIQKVKALKEETNVRKIRNDLQFLHRKWKETGPVSREVKENKWEEFKQASAIIHQRIGELNKLYYLKKFENKEKKQTILKEMNELIAKPPLVEREWRKKIKQMDNLRRVFLEIGNVPRKDSKAIWEEYKRILRAFNHNKNYFYRALRKSSEKYNEEKKVLLEEVLKWKNSTKWEEASKEMIQLQARWKKIEEPSARNFDKLWVRFNASCNYFFERYHAYKEEKMQEYKRNYKNKKAFIEKFKESMLPKEDNEAFLLLKEYCKQWETLGDVSPDKLKINHQFNQLIENSLDGLNLPKEDLEEAKLMHLIQQILMTNDRYLLQDEIRRTHKKIQELEKEISQMENNIGFFSSSKKESPLLKSTMKTIINLKEAHAIWSKRYKRLIKIKRPLQNT